MPGPRVFEIKLSTDVNLQGDPETFFDPETSVFRRANFDVIRVTNTNNPALAPDPIQVTVDLSQAKPLIDDVNFPPAALASLPARAHFHVGPLTGATVEISLEPGRSVNWNLRPSTPATVRRSIGIRTNPPNHHALDHNSFHIDC